MNRPRRLGSKEQKKNSSDEPMALNFEPSGNSIAFPPNLKMAFAKFCHPAFDFIDFWFRHSNLFSKFF
jgi:hypothetical protein